MSVMDDMDYLLSCLRRSPLMLPTFSAGQPPVVPYGDSYEKRDEAYERLRVYIEDLRAHIGCLVTSGFAVADAVEPEAPLEWALDEVNTLDRACMDAQAFLEKK